jgi:NAD(P)-dependent dehydrogenase (short-subunit alcohol dehydrogenase family)
MIEKTNIVLITGANGGVGFEIARKIASENPDYHILMGSRDLRKGNEAAKILLNEGLSVEPIQIDVRDDESISNAKDQIEKRFRRLDVLINNAGICIETSPEEESLSLRELYQRTFDTNTFGAASTTEAFIPLMRKSKNPRIVFITSTLGSFGITTDPKHKDWAILAPAYSSSKAAMNKIMVYYAVKLKEEGFKVNASCPGLCKTNLSDTAKNYGDDPRNGAINAARLATLGPDGPTCTASNKEDEFPW